ncbi:MAG: hypothetical protein KDK78_08400 [Chlamydiia bacterium]|nr:hypothetical protein [Chlamydiia bacterium]
MSNLTVDSHSRPAPIIDQQTGKLNSRFKHQAELVGLSFEGKSLAMVNEELQERCYQSDYEFYKQGNENPRFKISYDQAVQFLNDEYSDRSTEFPKDKQMGTCIFMGGALATVERRGYGLACAMRKG